MKLETIIPLVTPNEIHAFVRNHWQTDIFRQSHDEGGFVHDVIDKFAQMPCFFFQASDEYLEKAHFSTWWRGMQIREYGNPYIHDLYELHEIFHASEMLFHPQLSFEAFKRKMQDNELDASVCSEIEAYFRLPALRQNSFGQEIFADRFLNDPKTQAHWATDPERTVKELRMHRQNIMMGDMNEAHKDRAEFWIKQFSYQNESWASIWVHQYKKVEQAMVAMRDMVDSGDKAKALQNHIAWLTSPEIAQGGTVPFPDEAKAFAGVYWANKAAYDRDYAAAAAKPAVAYAPKPAVS
jgi:hypothetical protein